VRSVAFSPDGALLAWGRDDATVVVALNPYVPDPEAPVAEITEGPAPGSVVGAAVTFGYAGTDNVTPASALQFSYRFDEDDWSGFSRAPGVTRTLSHGPHTFSVRARDQAGNIGQPVTRAFFVDAIPSSIPAVLDAGAFTSDNARLSASWSSSDPESGIEEYQYAIGTSPGDPGSGYVVAWKSAGTATQAAETGLSLQEGVTYYWYVRARNGVGLWSDVGASDGITVDLTPPQTSITGGPSQGSYTSAASASFSWSGTDNLAASGDLRFQWRLDNGEWSSWSAQRSVELTGLGQGPHTFSVRGRDGAGNVESPGASVSWTVDLTPPGAPVVRTGRVNGASSVAASASAEDPESGISGYEYALVHCEDVTGASWSWAGGGPELAIGGLSLAPGERYILAVRAVNGAGVAGAAGYSEPFLAVGEQLLSEDFEGAFELVDWPSNNGACALDGSPVGKARVPAGWAYASDDWGNSAGFGEVSVEGGGKAALVWSIRESVTLASPVVRLVPGQYVFRFRARCVGARTGGSPSPVNNVYLEWSLYGSGRRMPSEGWELGRYIGHKSPLPQGQGFDWTEYAIPFSVEREGDYRVGLYVGSLASGEEEGLALVVDDVAVYRAGAGVSVTDVTSSSVTLRWSTHRASQTRLDWGTAGGLLTNSTVVPGTRTSHVVTLSGLSANADVFSRAVSPAGAGCAAGFESYLVPHTKPSSPVLLNGGFEGSVSNWKLYRTGVGPWQGYWGMSPQSGSFFVAVGGQNRRVNAGVMQRVRVTPGWRYRVTAWGNTRVVGQPAESTRCVLVVDPEGGFDPYRGDLPSVSVSTQGVWRRMTLEVEATGDVLSVFGLMQQDYRASLNVAGLDSFSVVGDGTAPSVPVVVDTGAFTGSLSQLSASWASSDAETGIEEYEYAIGTSPADPGSGYVVGWKSAGTATQATETGLSLQEGVTYYWYVRARNGVGLWSPVGVSDGILVDASAPVTPVVDDGGVYTTDGTRLQASWTSSDPHSGIAEYQYAIGTSPADPGSGYVVAWKSAGTATQATETGLSLQEGVTYYWYVRARNGAGLWSQVGASDGILVESSPPSTPVVDDGGAATAERTRLQASWTSSDPHSGISEYRYAIGVSPTDPGSGYVVAWKSAGTATQAMETGLSLQEGVTYYWYVRARNGVGLWSDVGTSDGITVDLTPPDTSLTGGPSASSLVRTREVTFTFAGTDNLAAPGDLRFQWSLDNGEWSPASSEPSARLTGLSDGVHTFRVRAVDLAGNVDGSPAEVTWRVLAGPALVAEGAGRAKLQADGVELLLTGCVVSAGTGRAAAGRAYVESVDRSSGIAVSTPLALVEGDVVEVAGRMSTDVNGERVVSDAYVAVVGRVDPVVPVGQTLAGLAGGPFAYSPVTGAGQRGVMDPAGRGLNTTGLLVRVSGWVSEIDGSFVYLNEGSLPANRGVRVSRVHAPSWVQVNDFVVVTGISSMRRAGLSYQLVVRPRSAEDFHLVTHAD
jgi:hypothetical protein